MNITINVLFSLTEQEAISLHYRLSSIGTFVVMYPLEGMTSSKIDDLLRTTSAYIYDHTSLNFTVLCRLEKCLPFLSEVKEKQDNPQTLATFRTQDTRQINVRENQRVNQEWTIHRHWQH
jgi:hypothetical protein